MYIKSMVNNLSLVFLLCAILLFSQRAAAVNINFDEFTTSGVSVDTLSIAGVGLTSGGAWLTDHVNSSKFTLIYDRCITAFPDGAAALAMDFDLPQTSLSFSIGSPTLGVNLSVSVTGYLYGSQVFLQSFTTSAAVGCTSPPCGDEVLVQIPGPVDRVVVLRTTGESVGPFFDNLQGTDTTVSIPTMNEWGMIIMSLFLGGSALWILRRHQIS